MRALGVTAGLITFIGSYDKISAQAAAQALRNVRRTHIESLEAFGERLTIEKKVSAVEVRGLL